MSNDISELVQEFPLNVNVTTIADVGFNRFDDELIDRYFNEDGKRAFEGYIAKREQEAERRGRIDELKKYFAHYGDDYDHYIDQRLAELNRASKGGE